MNRRPPSGDDGAGFAVSTIRNFDFVSDASGRITWCEPRVAPMVTGTDLGQFPQLLGDLRQHRQIRGGSVALAGAAAIAGIWQIDADPRFSQPGAHFLGHIGRFRRRVTAVAPSPDPQPESLGQVLHELRNPANAIQGFGEIIQQQMFGPAPHEYRALAALIAADSARILAGFEELERLARHNNQPGADAAADRAGSQSDLAACVAMTVDRLKPYTEPRASRYLVEAPDDRFPLRLAALDTERVCWRLLATLAGCAGPAETLRLQLARAGAFARLTMQMPAVLARLNDDALLHVVNDTAHILSASLFGPGFALRLAASEAAAAGGRLERAGDNLTLFLPLLDEAAPTPEASPDDAGHSGHA